MNAFEIRDRILYDKFQFLQHFVSNRLLVAVIVTMYDSRTFFDVNRYDFHYVFGSDIR